MVTHDRAWKSPAPQQLSIDEVLLRLNSTHCQTGSMDEGAPSSLLAVAVAAAALLPLPSSVVERLYSTQVYPAFNHF